MHNRSIQVHSFEREDGLWDLEAELIDDKSYSYTKRNGTEQPAHKPFHHMHIRITIDTSYEIKQAHVCDSGLSRLGWDEFAQELSPAGQRTFWSYRGLYAYD
ncbi:MAG: hypothetical protein RI904_926 [Pseudomonadota bacterium]